MCLGVRMVWIRPFIQRAPPGLTANAGYAHAFRVPCAAVMEGYALLNDFFFTLQLTDNFPTNCEVTYDYHTCTFKVFQKGNPAIRCPYSATGK
ncbi:hypothetical protein P4O66_017431 [Electrophorus voltai]|uniref:Uncharacterized protein n=1 Tax=Electrophorus voltai TaxID=2609070 RepID=A0AAD8YUA7_9TELE|nr:hypothetical protein P4O66_017431 [Electrophorus voltai]